MNNQVEAEKKKYAEQERRHKEDLFKQLKSQQTRFKWSRLTEVVAAIFNPKNSKVFVYPPR